MYEAIEIAEAMWVVAKNGDVCTRSGIYDSGEQARDAAAAFNSIDEIAATLVAVEG